MSWKEGEELLGVAPSNSPEFRGSKEEGSAKFEHRCSNQLQALAGCASQKFILVAATINLLSSHLWRSNCDQRRALDESKLPEIKLLFFQVSELAQTQETQPRRVGASGLSSYTLPVASGRTSSDGISSFKISHVPLSEQKVSDSCKKLPLMFLRRPRKQPFR